jgi:hypothetical protein
LFPVQHDVFKIIREKYGHLALVFWSEVMGDSLYLIWKPKAFLPEKFTVLGTVHRFPCVSDSDLKQEEGSLVTTQVLNVPAIISEIFSEGRGVFADFEMR